MGDRTIEEIMEGLETVKFLEVSLNKNGILIEKKTDIQEILDFVQENGSADPGGAADAELIQIAVAAGDILEIYNLSVQSETGNKPFGIGTSTAAVFASPFAGMAGAALLFAGTTGTGLEVNFQKDEKPLVIVDNSAGTVILYCYIFAYTGYLGIVQVNLEEMGASYSGYMTTP